MYSFVLSFKKKNALSRPELPDTQSQLIDSSEDIWG